MKTVYCNMLCISRFLAKFVQLSLLFVQLSCTICTVIMYYLYSYPYYSYSYHVLFVQLSLLFVQLSCTIFTVILTICTVYHVLFLQLSCTICTVILTICTVYHVLFLRLSCTISLFKIPTEVCLFLPCFVKCLLDKTLVESILLHNIQFHFKSFLNQIKKVHYTFNRSRFHEYY